LARLPRTLIILWTCGVARAEVTFNRDVLPILQTRCQQCHREGQIAPMPFETYRQTRPWTRAIREAVLLKKMPPWFADPAHGKFANDPSLTVREIETLVNWADSGSPEGTGEPPVRALERDWNIPRPDAIFAMAEPFEVPASGAVDYQYFPVPTGFTEDRWVEAVEVRPGRRDAVHHVVVYIREKGSTWQRGPTKSDILGIYTPGNQPGIWGAGRAKKIPAGADLVFQIHYTPMGKPAVDRTSVGIVFARETPKERVQTLQLDNDRFAIPPGRPDYAVSAQGSLPNDATLLSFFPHMHLRGAGFEYSIIPPKGPREVLLRVNHYDFFWQLTYILKEPLRLPAGTRLEATGWFDNSSNNARNPDPSKTIRFGEQSWEEMMIGFFDVAVPASMDKQQFFVRPSTPR
jgi:hypothetical protein